MLWGDTDILQAVFIISAYVQEPIYIELDLKTPRHGDRPFETGHIDHTELGVKVISGHTGAAIEEIFPVPAKPL